MLRAASQATITPASLPAFSAYLSANQVVAANVETKVNCDAVEFNVGGFYNNTTFRFQPTAAGYYQVNITGRGNGTTVTAIWFVLRKNNVNIGRLMESSIGGTNSGSMLVFLNGTDYIELFGLVNAASGTIFDVDSTVGVNGPRYSACLVRPA